MREATLASEIDFAGWRDQARILWQAGERPETVTWRVGEGGLLLQSPPPLAGEVAGRRPVGGGAGEGAHGESAPSGRGSAAPTSPASGGGEKAPLRVPRRFLDLAQGVILHRDAGRFDLLYRLLWRMADDPTLLEAANDPDIAAALRLEKAVNRAAHKMKAFVRFREVVGEPQETFVAWFEPAHRIVERTAPFFVDRFANQVFSILTPEVCAHWDGRILAFGPGAQRSDAPSGDVLEDAWRTYYGAIFNPARLMPQAMQREMPKRYWKNLPEAQLIPELIAAAPVRAMEMVRRSQALARPPGPAPASLAEVAAGAEACRLCPHAARATQAVSSEGPADAAIMLVGEQPGDQEDLAGRPFVGPAGEVLDRALAAADLQRERLLVTNAVRHFKHELAGKRRLHKTPGSAEIEACRWWLQADRTLVRPRVTVALGATAAHALLGRPTPVKARRGRPETLADGGLALIAWHPSYILRAPEAVAATAFAELVEDLRLAAQLADAT